MYMTTLNMSSSFKYSSYGNVSSTTEVLDATSHNLYLRLIMEVKNNLIDSILIDELTDRTCQLHFIVYVCYFTGVKFDSTCVQFMEL